VGRRNARGARSRQSDVQSRICQAGQRAPPRCDVGHDLSLALPADSQFLAPPDAGKVLEKLGSFHHDNLLGLVAPQAEEDWFVTLRYEDEGYIKDDEAIDANELLSTVREGVTESNDERVQKGFKALKVDGWSDPPRYDKARHHLVWALEVSDEDGKSVNFNTRVLGRRGYVSVNLVTAPGKLSEYKPRAAALLGATTFAAAPATKISMARPTRSRNMDWPASCSVALVLPRRSS
jgi:uncharacterized membrane-anchored protein